METDIQIIEGEVVFDDQLAPSFFSGKGVIEQSLRNRIEENNFMVRLIGERLYINRLAVYESIKLEVEEDLRVIPGTCSIAEESNLLMINATSEDGESLYLEYEFVETVPGEAPKEAWDVTIKMTGVQVVPVEDFEFNLQLAGVQVV